MKPKGDAKSLLKLIPQRGRGKGKGKIGNEVGRERRES